MYAKGLQVCVGYTSVMLVPEKKCAVCKLVRTNKPLLKRLYESSYFLPHSRDTLLGITRDYKGAFSYGGLKNHMKKHQFIDSQDYTEKMLQHTDKQLEQGAVRRAVKAVDAVQTVIDKGFERLENGDITVDTNQLIRASQVKMTQEAKQKDQELATIEMIAHFLSEEGSDKVFVPNETNNPINP